MEATVKKERKAGKFKRWGAFLLVGAALFINCDAHERIREQSEKPEIIFVKRESIQQRYEEQFRKFSENACIYYKNYENVNSKEPLLEKVVTNLSSWVYLRNLRLYERKEYIEQTLVNISKIITEGKNLHDLYIILNGRANGLDGINDKLRCDTIIQKQALEYLITLKGVATKDEIIGGFALLLLSSKARSEYLEEKNLTTKQLHELIEELGKIKKYASIVEKAKKLLNSIEQVDNGNK